MRFACRIPINDVEVPVDERMFKLLNLIHRMGSITVAARAAGIPYRSAIAYIRNVEDILGENIVETRRGGRGGGGGSRLTETGLMIIKEYLKLKRALERQKTVNELEGVVEEVSEDGVRVRVGGFTIDAAHADDLSSGDRVILLVEPDDIVLMREMQNTSMRNIIHGIVTGLEMRGGIVGVMVDAGDGLKLETHITPASQRSLHLELGTGIYAGFKAVAVTVLKI
ncbi:MAG: TOBE domain-containing protein [Methanothermobacter sp.]|nr:TOBE domain-containing protein [Methanothermobacter sp.]